MEYTNALKGTLTQAAICCALRSAGYPIVQTGVEVLLPALPHLNASAVASLDIGAELRSLPDLMILPQAGTAQQIEVKYRKRIDRVTLRLLMEKLAGQQEHYPETHTVLVRSVSPKGEAARVDDLIRVLPPHKLEVLAAADLFFHNAAGEVPEELRLEPLWQALRPMTSAFDRFQGSRDLLERLVPLFRALSDL